MLLVAAIAFLMQAVVMILQVFSLEFLAEKCKP